VGVASGVMFGQNQLIHQIKKSGKKLNI